MLAESAYCKCVWRVSGHEILPCNFRFLGQKPETPGPVPCPDTIPVGALKHDLADKVAHVRVRRVDGAEAGEGSHGRHTNHPDPTGEVHRAHVPGVSH